MKKPVLNAYEVRNADYAIVHSESDEDFNQFLDALAIRDGERVIDVGGGYGSIFIRQIQRCPHLTFEYDLLDGGLFQLRKGQEKIDKVLAAAANSSVVRYLHQDATRLDLPTEYYDLVICKMFLHEIPSIYKNELIANLYRIVKPGGRIIVWNPDLNEDDHEFFTHVIKKKDELAGFESMVQNRHFLLNNDLCALMEAAGFIGFCKPLMFDYHLRTSHRLMEEFSGDREKLLAWNEYILKIADKLDSDTRNRLNIQISGDDIYINFKRGIFSWNKPAEVSA